MSRSKQKREQLKMARVERQAEMKRAEVRAAVEKGRIVHVDRSKIVSRSALPKIPDYYRDKEFTCRDCGVREVWTAKQQQHWYEECGGEIESTAVRCRECRGKEKARREAARKTHLEGVAKKCRN
ncbi:MAG TPA: zinc-ribbon domain containing protein [Verrucomicrobiae bacterium]